MYLIDRYTFSDKREGTKLNLNRIVEIGRERERERERERGGGGGIIPNERKQRRTKD